MKKNLKRIVIDTVGWVFIIFGVAGIFLPLLQGILFIIIGVYILSLHSRFAHQRLQSFKLKHPKAGEKIDAFDHRVRAFLGIDPLL